MQRASFQNELSPSKIIFAKYRKQKCPKREGKEEMDRKYGSDAYLAHLKAIYSSPPQSDCISASFPPKPNTENEDDPEFFKSNQEN